MFNPFSALTSKIYGALAIAAIVFAGVQTARIDGLWFIDGYADKLADANDTIKQMEQASKDARAAQLAMNKANTDRQTDIARKADANENDIVERGARYADSLPAKDYCRKASPASESGFASGGDASRDTAVILERADYDILVGNTARLVQIHQWGSDLIGQGLAVPVE